MSRRAVIVTSVPKNRERIRRATRQELGQAGIEAAVERYLQGGASTDPTSPPKRRS